MTANTLRIPRPAPAAFGLILFAGIASAQLPDGPGKELMIKVCSQCHEPGNAAAYPQDKEGWDDMLSDMMQDAHIKPSEAEYNTILNYLAAAFPAPPVNINTASAVEMQSALRLPQSQAAALVEYRDKNGKFKTIEDLKKVPGLDFARIEAKKAQIVF